MRGHGAVVVSSSLSGVVGRSIYLQLNAHLQAQERGLGRTNHHLDPEEGQSGLGDISGLGAVETQRDGEIVVVRRNEDKGFGFVMPAQAGIGRFSTCLGLPPGF